AENNTLLGIFTDGDLRRILEAESFNSQRAISEVMTKNPQSISKEEMAITSLEKMEKYEITSLAVVDNGNNIQVIEKMNDIIKLELS
ncbi:CBS domain-containing protein, partial [Francisella tularensis subsp. holarctica]|uniref:CBS domain-containing protein n=1 Tax=Francisella tularensis TaxID=263 RepID=UPI002381C3FC